MRHHLLARALLTRALLTMAVLLGLVGVGLAFADHLPASSLAKGAGEATSPAGSAHPSAPTPGASFPHSTPIGQPTSAPRTAPHRVAQSAPRQPSKATSPHTARSEDSPAARPVALQAGTQGRLRYLQAGGLTRSYLAVQPSHPSSRALPMIVVLHGLNSAPQMEEQRTAFWPLAVQGKAVLVYPTGFGETWNAGQGCCGRAGNAGVDDVAFVHSVVSDAMHHYRIDPHRIYLTGYSLGAKMALRIACTDPSPFAAVASFAAVPLVPCSSGTPVPVLLAAASGDTEVPYSAPGPVRSNGALLQPVTEVVSQLLAHNGCSASDTYQDLGGGIVSIATWSSCKSGKPVQLVTYQQNDHDWPGSTKAAPDPLAGVTTVPLQGLMWQFFSSIHS